MATRLPSGRILHDWHRRRLPKDSARRIIFQLDRAAWLLANRWYPGLFTALYVRDPLLWKPGRSASAPNPLLLEAHVRPEALKSLRSIRAHLAYLAKLVDDAIARCEAVRDSASEAWLRRQLEGLGKEGG